VKDAHVPEHPSGVLQPSRVRPFGLRRYRAWPSSTVVLALCALVATSWSKAAIAEGEVVGATRDAKMVWDGAAREQLLTDLSFRDIIDNEIRGKMSRGLPTTIVFTATLHQPGVARVLATTAQTCRVTWHVWEEAYRLEISKPGEVRAPVWTTTIEGVMRRCAEVHRLLTATRDQVPGAGPFVLNAKVQVNPVSDDVLQKIKRWVSRPTGTSTAAPGDALFSTFTGLFLQRVGEAERVLVFATKLIQPTVVLK
jgi:hypothetical protein